MNQTIFIQLKESFFLFFSNIFSILTQWRYFDLLSILMYISLTVLSFNKLVNIVTQNIRIRKKRILKSIRIKEKPLIYQIRESINHPDNMLASIVKNRNIISKHNDNIYFSEALKFSKKETFSRVFAYMEELNIDTVTENVNLLSFNLKKLFSLISYYDFNEKDVKQILFDYGYSFAVVNSAFAKIYLDLDNIIQNSFLIYPNSDLNIIVKKIRVISTYGYTLSQIFTILKRAGYSNKFMVRIKKKIRLSQEANNSLLNKHYKRILVFLKYNSFKKNIFSFGLDL